MPRESERAGRAAGEVREVGGGGGGRSCSCFCGTIRTLAQPVRVLNRGVTCSILC